MLASLAREGGARAFWPGSSNLFIKVTPKSIDATTRGYPLLPQGRFALLFGYIIINVPRIRLIIWMAPRNTSLLGDTRTFWIGRGIAYLPKGSLIDPHIDRGGSMRRRIFSSFFRSKLLTSCWLRRVVFLNIRSFLVFLLNWNLLFIRS